MAVLEAIRYSRGSLDLLDQRLLPNQTVYLPVRTCEDAHKLIADMAVRGAPAIAVAGVLGLAVELQTQGEGSQFASATDAASVIKQRLDYLVTSRPTAVNMLDASNKLKHLIDETAAAPGSTSSSVVAAVIAYAENMMVEDVATNKAIGAHGMEAMLHAAKEAGRGQNGKLRVLTHCNTGSLATAAYGTALGCIRALHAAGKLEHAYCTETRPYNQGARLTAYELVVERIPATLIADSAAAALMAAGRVDAVVVGADRVAANGDTANKVGTLMLSVVAAAHGVPFFVAAPTTSIDCDVPSGDGIEIEQRSATELTHSTSHKDVRVVAEGIGVWNPAFDVARARDITGIITEKGCVPKQGAAFQMEAFFKQHGLFRAAAPKAAPLPTPSGFRALDLESVKQYVAAHEELREHVGPAESVGSWTSREIGDGNINFVYVVSGPTGGVILKQGLPFVRCVGESWPLSQERLAYEARSLQEMHSHAPVHIPEVFKYDRQQAIIAMQYLAPPHVILRYGILDGHIYPDVAAHLAELLASTLFRTSLLAMDSATYREKADRFSNSEMCKLTEGVIFTDPYYASPNNRHTTPYLDAAAEALRADVAAKASAAAAKALFCERRQALLHGDLHTGSLMVSPTSTFAIDSEFAFYGPMAFDLGKLVGNFLLTYFALDGHATKEQPREEQQAWILHVTKDMWNMFSARFVELWNKEGLGSAAYAAELYGGDAPHGHEALVECQTRFVRTLLDEALLFAGCCMVRRLFGIAHNADFERIADPAERAKCELRAFALGRSLLVEHAQYHSIETVVDRAIAIRNEKA